MSAIVLKNTVLLYTRMLLTLLVGFYTSRLILSSLGIEDFGIYTILVGLSALLGFVNNSLTSVMQRFLSISIKNQNVTYIFNICLSIQLFSALIFILMSETLGCWFLNEKLNIPVDKLDQAKYIYQVVVISNIFPIIQSPFNALIIAKERIDVFAKLTIFEMLTKLFLVYILVNASYNKLTLHSFLMCILMFITCCIYVIYCKLNFKEIQIKLNTKIEDYIKILQYSSWIMLGSIANLIKIQGANLLINIFYGTAVNSAYGIMLQLSSVVNLCASNFMQAINPKIFKSYSTSNAREFQKLVMFSSRVGFSLIYLIVLPVVFLADSLLSIWLVEVPNFTAIFIKLVMINFILDSMSHSLITAIQSSEKIKWYQITASTLIFLNLPVSYLLMSWGYGPESLFVVSICISFLCLLTRLLFLKSLAQFDLGLFINEVITPILMTIGLSIFINIYLINIIHVNNIYIQLITQCFAITLTSLAFILLIMTSRYEKSWICKKVILILNH